MPQLDLSTLFVLTAAVDVGFAAVMGYVYLTEKTYPGFRDWALGSVLQAVGLVLLITRGTVPLVISAVLAGMLVIVSADRMYRGIRRFVGQSGSLSAADIVVYSTTAAAMLYFLLIDQHVEARILVFSLGIAYPCAKAAAFCVFRLGTPYRLEGWILAAAFGCSGAVNLWRGAAAWWFAAVPGGELLHRGNTEALPLTIATALMVPLITMFLVLTGKRLRTELEDAHAQVRRLEGIIPICMFCKKIRVDPESWQQLEHYLIEHSDAQFSHGLCPECLPRFEGR